MSILEFPANPNNLTATELELQRCRIVYQDELREEGIVLTDEELDAIALDALVKADVIRPFGPEETSDASRTRRVAFLLPPIA
jgi:RIO-like serine/threonine protein kinase